MYLRRSFISDKLMDYREIRNIIGLPPLLFHQCHSCRGLGISTPQFLSQYIYYKSRTQGTKKNENTISL